MIMKKGLTVSAVIVALTVFLSTWHYAAANSAQNTTPAFTTSRFMLLSGTYAVVPDLKGEPVTNENGIFRLDSYTGKVWKLSVTVDPEGKRTEKWVQIEDKQ